MSSGDRSSSPSQAPPEQPSAFERWRRKAALVTGLGVTEEERLEDLRAHQTRSCEKTKAYLMEYSEWQHFLPVVNPSDMYLFPASSN